MTLEVRELRIEDKPDVLELTSKVWEDDYVPARFDSWLNDPLWHPIGCFEDGAMIGIAALEIVRDANIGWVKALRVREESRNHHVGSQLVEYIIEYARSIDIETVWYATSTRNEASIALAERVGFKLINKVGYLRLFPPFPPHPKPSPNLHPLIVDGNRLAVILEETPDLIDSSTIPIAWEFDRVTPEGLSRLGKKAEFKVMITEDGKVKGLYYRYDRVRQDIKTTTFAMFSNDRTIFVDMMARIMEEVDNSDANRAVFFMGKNAHEWIDFTIKIPEDYVGRQFLLFELDLSS